jgi:tetratricopeptide (TPR) repeat protein
MAQLNSQGAAKPGADIHPLANALFDACSQFMSLLDNPPADADKDAIQNARAYRADIWLIETSVALEPAVNQPQTALDCLAKLDALKAESKSILTDAQQTAMPRYRIQAYQMNGQSDQALTALQNYAVAQGKEPTDVIHAMAYSTIDEISQSEKTNPEHAKELAQFVVKLLDPLIAAASKDSAQRDAAYGYQKLQADMLVRAGQYADAQTLAVKLETAHPEDLFNYMTEARALFEHARATADAKLYTQAQDLFTRILPKVTNGSDSYWECWLRILQSKEILGGPDAPTSIKQHLGDLHIAFGDKIGGTTFQVEFARLLEKYGA